MATSQQRLNWKRHTTCPAQTKKHCARRFSNHWNGNAKTSERLETRAGHESLRGLEPSALPTLAALSILRLLRCTRSVLQEQQVNVIIRYNHLSICSVEKEREITCQAHWVIQNEGIMFEKKTAAEDPAVRSSSITFAAAVYLMRCCASEFPRASSLFRLLI